MPEEHVEPTIAVNGHTLNQAQAMTVRVALESFAALLSEPYALGTDGHARELTELYKMRLAQVQMMMYE
jgi:hypothetical protein